MPFFTDEQADLLAQSVVRSAWLVEMQFKSATSRIWAGDTDLEVGGHIWRPTYGGAQIDGLGFAGQPGSSQVTITASGVDQELLGMALAEANEADQQPAIIYLQLFDDAWQPVGGLAALFFGLMQQPRVSRTALGETEGSTQSITLPIENMFFSRARPPAGRYTPLDQNKRTATQDDIFNFVWSLTNKRFTYPDF